MFYAVLNHLSRLFLKNKENSNREVHVKLYYFIASFSACVGIGLWMRFEEIKRRQKIQHQEFMNAVNRFYSLITLINLDTKQVDSMLKAYERSFARIYQTISEILPIQEQSIETSSRVISKSSSEVDLDELRKIYKQSVLAYPKLPNLKNMSVHAIHAECDQFEEYHEQVREYSIFLIGKNAEQLSKYELMLSDAKKIFKQK
jgi:hypothetical protein